MGLIGYTETLARNYHYSLHNNPEEGSSHLFHGISLKSCITHKYMYRNTHVHVIWG